MKKFLTAVLAISVLFVSSFYTTAYAASNPISSLKDNNSYSETYFDNNNKLHVKSKLIEFTPDYQKFVTVIGVPGDANQILARSSVGKEVVYTTLHRDGTFEIEVQCYAPELIKYGTIHGLRTYGAIGSRKYGANLKASNFTPGPVLTFEHNFTGMSTYHSGTQYIEVGPGELTLVNGAGSFTSFTTDVDIQNFN
ncbi:hypothetical protein [Caproiciproducens galactitolivorans]|uniref:hypothetical protein n=1 Tax=Caproiciproducens galactitolivorans TaxID=642589 RepID=UPI002409B25E|nr:hypothetical protein [Caproiciproducens galactitolivorans]